jgi:hypothetical protein
MPCAAFQCFCRAGLHAARTTTAEASFYCGPALKRHVGENGSQSNPCSEPARDKLTMTTDPPQTCSCCSRFVGNVPFDINPIGTIRSSQRFGSKTSGLFMSAINILPMADFYNPDCQFIILYRI